MNKAIDVNIIRRKKPLAWASLGLGMLLVVWIAAAFIFRPMALENWKDDYRASSVIGFFVSSGHSDFADSYKRLEGSNPVNAPFYLLDTYLKHRAIA